jgi:hypothetical protein
VSGELGVLAGVDGSPEVLPAASSEEGSGRSVGEAFDGVELSEAVGVLFEEDPSSEDGVLAEGWGLLDDEVLSEGGLLLEDEVLSSEDGVPEEGSLLPLAGSFWSSEELLLGLEESPPVVSKDVLPSSGGDCTGVVVPGDG